MGTVCSTRSSKSLLTSLYSLPLLGLGWFSAAVCAMQRRNQAIICAFVKDVCSFSDGPASHGLLELLLLTWLTWSRDLNQGDLETGSAETNADLWSKCIMGWKRPFRWLAKFPILSLKNYSCGSLHENANSFCRNSTPDHILCIFF